MNWRKIASVVFAVAILVVTGCSVFGGSSNPAGEAVTVAKGVVGSVAGVNFGILDIIAVLAALGAAGTVVAWGFGMPVPPKVTIACIAVTVGAWILKLILVQYLWILVILFLLAIVLFGAAFAYTHIGWIEDRLNKDLNGNGTVGK